MAGKLRVFFLTFIAESANGNHIFNDFHYEIAPFIFDRQGRAYESLYLDVISVESSGQSARLRSFFTPEIPFDERALELFIRIKPVYYKHELIFFRT